MNNLDLNPDTSGEEKDKGENDWDDNSNFNILILFCLNIFENGKLHTPHLGAKFENYIKYGYLKSRLKNAEENDSPKYHEQKYGIEE